MIYIYIYLNFQNLSQHISSLNISWPRGSFSHSNTMKPPFSDGFPMVFPCFFAESSGFGAPEAGCRAQAAGFGAESFAGNAAGGDFSSFFVRG